MSVDDFTSPQMPCGDNSSPRRWYDQDPLLIEVLELLRAYPMELEQHAKQFMRRLEEQVGASAFEDLFNRSVPQKTGHRWYDDNPVLFRAIELLRIVPTDLQHQAAQRFLAAMQKQGLNPETLQEQKTANKVLQRALVEEGPLPVAGLDRI